MKVSRRAYSKYACLSCPLIPRIPLYPLLKKQTKKKTLFKMPHTHKEISTHTYVCVYREREIFIVCKPHGYHKPKIYNRYTQKQRKVSNWYLLLLLLLSHISRVRLCATQSCPTLRNPMHCNVPGPSVHGIFQARVLE